MRNRLLLIILLSLLLHGYIGWQLVPALAAGPFTMLLYGTILLLSALLMPAALIMRLLLGSHRWADLLGWLSYGTMGIFSSLLILTFVRQLLLLFLPGSWSGPTAVAVVAGALAISLIGLVGARRLAQVVRVKVPLANLPPQLAGFTIAQISDIHVGTTIKGNYVRAIVERVNALEPNLIAITGDLVDGNVTDLGPHIAPLADLKADHGAFVVTGNHEYYAGVEEWMKEFKRLGLRLLLNSHEQITHNGAPLIVAGVADYSAAAFNPDHASDPAKAVAGSPSAAIKVLLAHQPRSAPAAAAAGIDLQLSGHTHGGQFWPWNLFVPLQQPFTAGLHRLGKLWVYTSRGTGYWGPPKRFGAPSEITLIELVEA